MKNFVEELRWRGMLQDLMPGTEQQLQKERTTAYLGIDPTADSLHIGHLCGIMLLKHLQQCGHRPIVLVGGATGMIGDPSGKSAERNLLDAATLEHNVECIKKQLARFLTFQKNNELDPLSNDAILVNNYDWMKNFTFIDFARDIGKHITVNYMMAKDSVKKRFNGEFSQGMSFTEFTYQLLQGYDYVYLNRHYGCKLQVGGSDQWGNITTGAELIRRLGGEEVFALTCPLITKADGGKFGKTESGNIWLDSRYTSPYTFYQFWLNVSDQDAERYIKIFTTLSQSEIEGLILAHNQNPHLRILQKKLAEEVTVFVHSADEFKKAKDAGEILFGDATNDQLNSIEEDLFLEIFGGVSQFEIPSDVVKEGIPILNLLTEQTSIFSSKGEARKMIQQNGLSLNKKKVADAGMLIDSSHLINAKYLLFRKGKKDYYLVKVM